MHVVWINDRADFVGGAERYVAETAARLAHRGIRSTLLYDVEGWTEPRFVDAFDGAFPRVRLTEQLRDLAPDVVYAHQVRSPAPLEELRTARAPVVRFFHDHALFCLREHKYTAVGNRTCTQPTGVHCYTCLGFIGRSRRFPGLAIRSLGELETEQRRHAALLDAAVVGSTYMRDHAVAHGFPAERVHVLPLFVERPPPMQSIRREPHELLFVGALSRGKGLDVLLRALVELPREVTLRIIGEGPQRDELEHLAEDLRLGTRVRFEGRVSGRPLHRAYARAACLVLPSRAPETFGLTGPEALVHRTPVVASSPVGGMGEWLEDGVTGFGFAPSDPRSLAVSIRRVLADPIGARRMANEGARRVLERFSPERHDQALLSLFARLGARAPAAEIQERVAGGAR